MTLYDENWRAVHRIFMMLADAAGISVSLLNSEGEEISTRQPVPEWQRREWSDSTSLPDGTRIETQHPGEQAITFTGRVAVDAIKSTRLASCRLASWGSDGELLHAETRVTFDAPRCYPHQQISLAIFCSGPVAGLSPNWTPDVAEARA